MDDVIILISQTMTQDDIGAFVPGEPEEMQIFGTVSSVSRAEWYSAGQVGLTPEITFTTNAANYDGQNLAVYNGKTYSIYRTYFPQDSDTIELYLTREAAV